MIITVSLFCTSINVFAEVVKYGEEIKNQPGNEYKELFADVPQSYWAFQYIMDMSGKKIVSGYPDGKFRPEKTVSRAEYAKILASVIGAKAIKVSKSSFKDIKPSDWYSPYVEIVKKYITGYSAAGGSYVLNLINRY